MKHLELRTKLTHLIISDRKAYKRPTGHLERWLADVEDCKKMIVQMYKNLCKILDAHAK